MRRISSIRELKEFIDHLRHRVANRASPAGFAELDTALEKLKVAEEALHEQTQKLGEALEDFTHVSHAVRRVWQTEFMLDHARRSPSRHAAA